MAGVFLREQFLIERGEDFHASVVGNGDVARIVGASIGESDKAGMGEREGAAAAGTGRGSKMIGNFLESAVDGIKTDLGVALIVVTDIDATVVGGPLLVLDIAVEFVGEGMGIGAVAIHKIKLGSLMTLVAIIEAGVGNEFPVGRNGGRIVRTFASGQRAKRAVGDTEFVDFSVEEFVIGFGMAIDGSDQVLAIGRPGRAIGAKFVAAVREIAVGDLARGAAFAVYNEELHVAGVEITGAIKTIHQPILRSVTIVPLYATRRH